MNIYRNTSENWLLRLLQNNHIKATGRFISFSLVPNSGGMDDFGKTRITLNRELLDEQGLEEIFYEPEYFELHPEISQYVSGYGSEQQYYDDKDFDNAEEAYDQSDFDWKSFVESYEHEEELVLKELTYKPGMVLNVMFSLEPSEELKQLLDKNSIEYSVKMEEFKTFEAYSPDLKEKAMMSGIGCKLNSNGEYDCSVNIILNSMYVKNGKLSIKFGKIEKTFSIGDVELTSLEGCPKEIASHFYCQDNHLTNLIGGPTTVSGDYICYNNYLTSLEGCAKLVGKNFNCSGNMNLTSLEGGPLEGVRDYDVSGTGITDLKGSPKRVQHLGIEELHELKTLYGGPEKVNTSPDFHRIKSKYLSGTEHGYWQRLLVAGALNNDTYFQDIFGLMVSENNLEEIHKIQWPQEILDIMPEDLRNLYRSKVGGNKFNVLEYYNVLRFEDFVSENLDKYYGKFDLSENIKTDTTELLSSIDLKEVDMYETLGLLVNDINLEGMTLDQLADNTHFINALEKLSLKKEEPQESSDSDTFLTRSLTFMGIYPIQVLEIQDPEYLMIQIGNGPIKLYKLSGSIKDFYDKLTSKTVEIKAGDKNWIYKTSNSGNNWELQNQKEGEVYKKVMTTQELEDSLNSNTKITVIS